MFIYIYIFLQNAGAELIKLIVQDFDKYLNDISELPEHHQLPPEKRKEDIEFVLITSLLKHRASLEKPAEENHLSMKGLEKYVKKALLSSSEINNLEKVLAQVVADERDISPRFVGKIKTWFVSKAVRVVGRMMRLPPAPRDHRRR